MTANCPLCGSEVSPNSPALILSELLDFIRTKGWDSLESDSTTYGYPVGKKFTVGARSAMVVAKKIKYDVGDLDADYYGGELPQGTTYETYIVIQVDEGFFKKTGTGDSYGDISWDGELKIVEPKEKVIKVYE